MRKFICGFIVGAIIFSLVGVYAATTYVANPLSYKVVVNGEEFTSDPPPVEIEGRTYLPLRAMGDALGVPVNWNETLGQAEVGYSIDIAEPNQYSRKNPAPINTAQTYTKSDKYIERNNYTVGIRIIDAIRGDAAWAKIKEANIFNSPAPDGYEYVLAEIVFSAISTNGDYAISISEYNFKVFTSNNEEVEQSIGIVEPTPALSGQAYPGGNLQGYAVFTVLKGDAAPKVVYGANYDGSGGIWFSLTK